MRHWLGIWLRRLADRIDDNGAPRAIGWWFTIEDGEGIRFRQDGRGCRLWYLGNGDYKRAHAEADFALVHRCSEIGNAFGGYNCVCGEPWLDTLGGCMAAPREVDR